MPDQSKDKSNLGAIQQEIVGLFNNIQKIKAELASIHHPGQETNLLGSAADQLNAIVEETTEATEEIMAATETIQEVNDQLITEIKFGGARPLFEKIGANVDRIFQACVFHDITGQRISKIVTTINILEGTLNSLVVTLGKDGIAALPMETKSTNRKDGDLELHGPDIGGPETSQEEIDKLFE